MKRCQETGERWGVGARLPGPEPGRPSWLRRRLGHRALTDLPRSGGAGVGGDRRGVPATPRRWPWPRRRVCRCWWKRRGRGWHRRRTYRDLARALARLVIVGRQARCQQGRCGRAGKSGGVQRLPVLLAPWLSTRQRLSARVGTTPPAVLRHQAVDQGLRRSDLDVGARQVAHTKVDRGRHHHR